MKTNVILLVSSLLIFAAGTSLGMLVHRRAMAATTTSELADRLKLSDDQQAQMKKIWSETGAAMRELSRQQADRRSTLSQHRDQALQDLLTAEQRQKYELIRQEYARGMEQLSQEREKLFHDAQARIRQILTPAQMAGYDEWVKQHEPGMGEGGWRGRHRRSTTTTTTSGPAVPHVERTGPEQSSK